MSIRERTAVDDLRNVAGEVSDRARPSAGGSHILKVLAVGALAFGALAIGALTIGRARIRRLEIDELVVRKLRVTDALQTPTDRVAESE